MLRSRDTFRIWTAIPVRYSDQDPLGHVNNAAMATYLEQARCELVLPMIRRAGVPGLDLVLARIVIDYLAELKYPGTAEVGTQLGHIGSKSFTLRHGVFAGAKAVATAEATLVFFDLTTRRSTAPPDSVRDELAALA